MDEFWRKVVGNVEEIKRRGCGREEAEEEEKSNIIMFMIS